MARGGTLTDFEGGGPMFTGPAFLTIPCDVLVPAALGGVITAPLAQKLQCKAVVEAANAPTTLEGDKVLRERVVVSFFEWVQNLQNFQWDDEEVSRRLDRYMTDAYHQISRLSDSHKVPLRVGAFLLAVKRVADAEKHRGFD
eukprot:gene10390-10548_t